jgi:hypothetical protein
MVDATPVWGVTPPPILVAIGNRTADVSFELPEFPNSQSNTYTVTTNATGSVVSSSSQPADNSTHGQAVALLPYTGSVEPQLLTLNPLATPALCLMHVSHLLPTVL